MDSKQKGENTEIQGVLTIMSEILACAILDEDSGMPLYTHFIDKELEKTPYLIEHKIKTREIAMIHELGIDLNLVFTLLARKDTPELREMLKRFRDRVEKTYPQGMQIGTGNWADYVILEGMFKSIFIDREE